MSRALPRDRLLLDVTRGVCGGLLFAVPLIFTMEMWWLGYHTPTARVIVYLVVAYGFLFGLNAFAGFREAHGVAVDLGDAVVSLAIGLVVSAVMMLILGEISADTSPLIALRQSILLALPVSLGVALSRSQLPTGDEEEADQERLSFASRLGMAIAGGLLLGMSAAPTEEIQLIASRVGWPHLAGMTAASLALTRATLFVADARGRPADYHPTGEVLLVYAVALLLSALMLGAFGFLHEGDPATILASIVTLGVPTTIGAAAGRLVL